jgi:hypothetical protein
MFCLNTAVFGKERSEPKNNLSTFAWLDLTFVVNLLSYSGKLNINQLTLVVMFFLNSQLLGGWL